MRMSYQQSLPLVPVSEWSGQLQGPRLGHMLLFFQIESLRPFVSYFDANTCTLCVYPFSLLLLLSAQISLDVLE